MDTELKCDCGNPACNARVNFRKGYVHIHHQDGRKEERWDWFHIWASGPTEGDKIAHLELMVPPKGARQLMWFLIRAYLPGIYHIDALVRRHIIGNCRYLIERLRETLTHVL